MGSLPGQRNRNSTVSIPPLFLWHLGFAHHVAAFLYQHDCLTSCLWLSQANPRIHFLDSSHCWSIPCHEVFFGGHFSAVHCHGYSGLKFLLKFLLRLWRQKLRPGLPPLQIGAQKIKANSFCTKFVENPSGHGPPCRKSWTSAPKVRCGPNDGEKSFDPEASKRKGQECPRKSETKKLRSCEN